MSFATFFTDEDVYGAVAPALRRGGLDAISTPEAGRHGASDDAQLAWSAKQGRVLVTFHVAHFAALHTTWMRHGQHHAGIVVSSQRPVGQVVGRLLRLASALNSEAFRDRLEYLGDW